MKKQMQEALITAGMIAVIILGGIVVQNRLKNKVSGPEVDIINSTDFFGPTGSTITGIISSGTIITGEVQEKPASEMDKFHAIDNKHKVTVEFLVQPTDYNGKDFAGRTQMLVDHAKNNMQTIKVPKGIKGGYLYIKLRKELPTGRTAVIYVNNNNGRHCGGGIKQLGFTYNNNEYLYKLSNVPLIGSDCGDNWLLRLPGNYISIGGYVGTFDGNGIEKITIARYF